MNKTVMKNALAVLILCMCGMLCACGGTIEYSNGDLQKSSIIIQSDGSLDAVLREDLPKENYSEEELVAFVEEELAAFNAMHSDGVVNITSHGYSGDFPDTMMLSLHFSNVDLFNEYMPEKLYVGTVQGAYDAGYDFDQALAYVKDPEHVIGKNDLMNMANRKLIIFNGDMRITVPGTITYYSQLMEQLGSDCVEPTENGTYFIIYE